MGGQACPTKQHKFNYRCRRRRLAVHKNAFKRGQLACVAASWSDRVIGECLCAVWVVAKFLRRTFLCAFADSLVLRVVVVRESYNDLENSTQAAGQRRRCRLLNKLMVLSSLLSPEYRCPLTSCMFKCTDTWTHIVHRIGLLVPYDLKFHVDDFQIKGSLLLHLLTRFLARLRVCLCLSMCWSVGPL